jgi:uncharacterized protein (TIGR03084 family)
VTEQPDVISALIADGNDLDTMLAGLSDEQWNLPTPAAGWTIKHQIAHLSSIFRLAAMAGADPEGFKAMASKLSDDFDANVHGALQAYINDTPEVLLTRWKAEHAGVEKALGSIPPGQIVPWLVRPLPAMVLASAGMMELFGHGQDIADALGVQRQHTDRIRFLAEFAVRTWDFGYLARGLTAPEVEFGYDLVAPSGAIWHLGAEDAAQRVSGPAVDFCLLVTRRRHREDLSLKATGVDANHWLSIAQAYRGSAGPGRTPGQFGKR